jgi:hypothetical protein
MRITKELAQKYFEMMVDLQPEDVVTILMDLYSGKLSQVTFVDNVTEDIIDTNRD